MIAGGPADLMKTNKIGLIRWSKRLALLLLLFFLVLVASAYIVLPKIEYYQSSFENYLSGLLQTKVKVGHIYGRFNTLIPAVVVDEFVIYAPPADSKFHNISVEEGLVSEEVLRFETLVFEIDILSTLLNFFPVFKRVIVKDGFVHLASSSGAVHFPGFKISSKKNEVGQGIGTVLGLLEQQQYIDVENFTFILQSDRFQQFSRSTLPAANETRKILENDRLKFKINNFKYAKQSSGKRMVGNVTTLDGSSVRVVAKTSAKKFSAWPNNNIEGYFELHSDSIHNWLSFYTALVDTASKTGKLPQLSTMQIDAKVWFNWNRQKRWQLRSDLAMPVVKFEGVLPETLTQIPELTNFSAKIYVDGKPEQTDVKLQQVGFNLAESIWQPEDYFVSIRHSVPAILAVASEDSSEFDSEVEIQNKQLALESKVTHNKNFILKAPESLPKVLSSEIAKNDLTLLLEEAPSAQKKSTTIRVAANRVNLRTIHQLSDKFIPPSATISEILKAMAPRGYLKHLALSFDIDDFVQTFKMKAQAENVAINSWRYAPFSSGISGAVYVNSKGGSLLIDSHDFSLGFPELFHHVWRYEHAEGQLNWRIDLEDKQLKLYSDNLYLKEKEGELVSQINIGIPLRHRTHQQNSAPNRSIANNLKTKSSVLVKPLSVAIKIGLKAGVAKNATRYIPSKLLSPELNQWFNTAIKSGEMPDAGFIWHSTHGVPRAGYEWSFYSKLSQGTLNYSEQWPALENISGELQVDNHHFVANVDHGTIYTAKTNSLKISIDNFHPKKGKSPLLAVQGSAEMNGHDLLKLINETPISEHPAVALRKYWQLEGTVKSDLILKMPLSNMSDYSFNIKASTGNSQFDVANIGMTLANMTGKVEIDSEKGIYSSHLLADLFGQPLSASINTNKKEGRQVTRMHVAGQMTTEALTRWLKQPQLDWLSGSFNYQAEVIFPMSDNARIVVKSNLKKVKSELPSPLRKREDESIHTTLTVLPQDKFTDFKLELASYASAWARVNELGEFVGANIHVGQGKARLPQHGVTVTGHYHELDLALWHAWLKAGENKFEGRVAVSEGPMSVKVQDIKIEKLKYGERVFNNVTVSAHADSGSLAVLMDTPLGNGTIFFPLKQGPFPLRIHLKKLLISDDRLAQVGLLDKRGEDNSSEKSKELDPLAAVNLPDIPRADIQIDSLVYEDKALGWIKAQVHPSGNRLFIRDIEGLLGKMKVKGVLEWSRQNAVDSTRFNGFFYSNQLNKTLTEWGYPEQIDSKQAEFDMNLNWKGSPMALRVDNLEGRVKPMIKAGRFLSKEAGGASVLRVFGILNLDTLTRRLRLDFSDLFKSGVSFDRLTGEVQFHNGLLNFSDPIDVKGPSSNFTLAGDIDLIKDQLDMELIVVLPVTQNLPIVGLLLGQPQIAGAVYLFDKLLGRSNKLSSVRYEITGVRDKPKVKLDKLFSSKVKKRKNQILK